MSSTDLITPTGSHTATSFGPEPARPPGPFVRAWRDCIGLIGLTLRLAWRHWPALLALAVAGTIGRELILTAALKLTGFQPLVAFVVFMVTPLALMVAMVLMLRTTRPSLPQIGLTPREPVMRHVGSVLLPFLVFYLYSGFLDYDYQRYAYGATIQEISDIFTSGTAAERLVTGSIGVAIIAAVAFILRWVLGRFEAVRRRPLLGVPAAYLEIVWIVTAFLIVRDYGERFTQWWENRVVWRAFLDAWHSDFAQLGQFGASLQGVRDYVETLWGAATEVLIVPVAALLSGAVVLAVSTERLRPRRARQSWFRRAARVGSYAAQPYGAVANLTRFANTVRLVFQTGLPMMMVYCLLFAAISTLDEWLNLPERLLIGSQDHFKVWEPLYFPLQWFNQAVGLVLLMCLVAAAVERSPLGALRPAGQAVAAEPSGSAPRSREGEADVAR